MDYTKGALTINEQIAQLKRRGLTIEDEAYAKNVLINVGYYRLAGYWWTLQRDQRAHQFYADATFNQAVRLYKFDRELRLLCFHILERIEVAVRTKMIYYPSHEFHAHWFEDPSLFNNRETFEANLHHINKEISRSKEQFIVHHRRTYRTDQRLPPAWKTLDVISMGSLSKLYKALSTGNCRDQIAIDLGLPNVTFLASWLQTFTVLRNICAHHSRLWNRSFRHVPKLLRKKQVGWLHEYGHDQKRLYIPLCCMVHTLRAITADRTIEDELVTLFEKYPSVKVTALGFPTNWRSDPFWQ